MGDSLQKTPDGDSIVKSLVFDVNLYAYFKLLYINYNN
jgi:hypothetical protein